MTAPRPQPLPGWTITAHARERIDARGISDLDLHRALEQPECSYPQTGSGLQEGERQVRVRGRWAVVVNPVTRTVITVLFASPNDWHAHTRREQEAVRHAC